MEKIVFKDTDWGKGAAGVLSDHINKVLSLKKKCSVFLTGGRGAARIYPFLATALKECKDEISFYLGDERCVAANHPDSNYGMILKTLFHDGIGNGWKLYKMYDAADDPETAATKYEKIIPEEADILILGLGDDGHVASLFPQQSWTNENDRKVIPAISPVNMQQRITITKTVIGRAKQIIVLASGTGKMRVLSELSVNSDIAALPARMALKGLWILDESAGGEIIKN